MLAVFALLALSSEALAQTQVTLDGLFAQIRPQSRALVLCFHARAEAEALATCDAPSLAAERALRACRDEESAHREAVVRIGGSDRYGDLADRMVAQAKAELQVAMTELVESARRRASPCRD